MIRDATKLRRGIRLAAAELRELLEDKGALPRFKSRLIPTIVGLDYLAPPKTPVDPRWQTEWRKRNGLG